MRQLLKGAVGLARQLVITLLITFVLLIAAEIVWEGSVSSHWNLNYLSILTIIFGALALWMNRGKIDLGREIKREQWEEFERKGHFGEKFPRIDRIPVVGWLARRMFEEGWSYSLVLIFLASFGFYIRIYSLGTQPFWIDEVISAVAASSIFTHGIPTLPSGITYDSAPLDQYIRAASFGVWGIDNFAARLPAVIFGMMTIPMTYLLGKQLGNRKVGIIAALLVTFCTMEIAWSRQARMYQAFQFLYILSLYLFLKAIDWKRVRYFVLLLLSLIAALMTNILTSILFAVFGLYIIIFERGRVASLFNYGKKHRVKAGLGIFAIVCPILVGLLAYGIPTVHGLTILPSVNNQLQYLSYLKDISPWVFLFFWIGLIGLLRRREGFLLALAVVIPWLIIFYWYEVVWYRYVYFTLPLFFIAASSALVLLSSWASKAIKLPRWAPSGAAYAVIIASLLYLCLNVPPLHYADAGRQAGFTFTPQVNYDLPRLPQTNFEKAYGYILNDLTEDDAVISLTTGLLPAYYYLGEQFSTESNYCFSNREEVYWVYKAYQEDDLWYEGYTGSRMLTSQEELREVVDSYRRGWLVIDHQKARYLSEGDYDYINARMRYYEAASDETIKVYSWGQE